MNIQLKRATEQERTIIEHLCQFYIYEFSTMHSGLDLQEDGLYRGLSGMDQYWSDPACHPFLVSVDEKWAGFVLVSEGRDGERNNMDEFFIMRKYMGRGVGSRIAMQVFDMFPGEWQVTQIPNNYPAQAFWRKVIGTYTQDQYTEYYDERRKSIQEFDNTSIKK